MEGLLAFCLGLAPVGLPIPPLSRLLTDNFKLCWICLSFISIFSMVPKLTHKILTYLIAAVWLINGLVCKILNLAPRHQQIVADILDSHQSELITMTIGVLEVFMAIWILSGIQSRFNAIVQMMIVAAMNVIEFILVPHLLLFGRLNMLIAIAFIGVIYCWEFVWNKKGYNVPIS